MKSADRFIERLITRIPEYLENGTRYLLDGRRFTHFNFLQAQKCIEWNYKKVGEPLPVIIVTENPLEMQLMFNFILSASKGMIGEVRMNAPELYSNLLDQLQESLNLQPEASIHDILVNQNINSKRQDLGLIFHQTLVEQQFNELYRILFIELEKNIDPIVEAKIHFLLKEPLRRLYGEELGETLDQEVAGLLANYPERINRQNPSYLVTMNFYSDCVYLWYEFLRKELDQELSINEYFQESFLLQRNSGISQGIFSRELCVISKYPKKAHVNPGLDLYNEKCISVIWGSYSPCTIMNAEECNSNGKTISLKGNEPDKKENENRA